MSKRRILFDKKKAARERAERNWPQWRLLCAQMVTYSELDLMDQNDILEANAALDLHIEMQEKMLQRQRGRRQGEEGGKTWALSAILCLPLASR